MTISGKTTLIAHIGYPTEAFKAPLIYNPWFEKRGIDAVVVPMGVKVEDYPAAVMALFKLTNIRGALITMPHKVVTGRLVNEITRAVEVAGACNAILKRPDGTLVGNMFDGAGFTRGLVHKGFSCKGAKCLIVGCGGVGSAIAASLAEEGARSVALFDLDAEAMTQLATRLRRYYPGTAIVEGSRDPAGYDLAVNCTPLGMKAGDPLPMDATRLAPSTFVGEVVMSMEITPLLAAARERGCRIQVGIDMLFEMIPAYLEFFGFGAATADELRAVAKITY
ncbi:MAG TPA: ThiF family adenylyltransferase [Usitatibacter sp.]